MIGCCSFLLVLSASPFVSSRLSSLNRPLSHQSSSIHLEYGNVNHLSKQKRNVVQTTQRLLAVRVSSSSSSEEPEESVASIQGAIFGYGSNPDGISFTDSTVVAQYAAISHDQLLFVPAVAPSSRIVGGVLDIIVDNVTFAGQSISDITTAVLEQTRDALGIQSLTDIADRVMFCLPTGGILKNDPNWTAFTYPNEPVRKCSAANSSLMEFNTF
jgi:hypothetical protein